VAQSSFNDEKQLAHLGTTSPASYVSVNRHLVEADLIITVGAIDRICCWAWRRLQDADPGLAASRTIAENHCRGER